MEWHRSRKGVVVFFFVYILNIFNPVENMKHTSMYGVASRTLAYVSKMKRLEVTFTEGCNFSRKFKTLTMGR